MAKRFQKLTTRETMCGVIWCQGVVSTLGATALILFKDDCMGEESTGDRS